MFEFMADLDDWLRELNDCLSLKNSSLKDLYKSLSILIPAWGMFISSTLHVKSIPPNTEKWLRKRYDENYNNDTSHATKRETNYSMNNNCNDMNTRNMHIT